MSDFRQTGVTRVTLPGISAPNQPANEFLVAVQDVAAAEGYEILGEMGQGRNLSIVYLARDLHSKALVALKLEPGVGEEYLLDLVAELDETIPTVEGECPRCGGVPRGWERFCTQCGYELAGSVQPSPELLEAVKEAAGQEFEILGQMSHAKGGGLVYFARELATGNLVALRIRHEKKDEYAMAMTGVLKPLAETLGANPKPKPKPAVQIPSIGPAPPPPPAPRPPARTNTATSLIELLQQPLFLGLSLTIVVLLLLIVLVLLLR